MIEKLPLNDNFVCLDTKTGALSLANPVAARIHELHAQGDTPAEITATLVAEYAAPESVIAADVHAFLSELATSPKRQLKPDQNHEPDTSYRPHRPCAPIAIMVCHLPTCRIHVQSESAQLLSLMTPFFQLTPDVVQQEKDLVLSIFKEGDTYPLVFEGNSLDIGASIDHAAHLCIGVINTIAASTEPHAFTLHAAAVSRNHRGILFPARGGSGKTTLSAFLTQCGYKLINDDSVHLAPCENEEQTVQIMPLPSPLSIKSGSWQVLTEYLPALSLCDTYSTGPKTVKMLPASNAWVQVTPVPCHIVINPQYEAGAACTVEPMSASESLEILIESGCYIPQPVTVNSLAVLVNWLSRVKHYRLRYSSLQDAEKAMRQLLELP